MEFLNSFNTLLTDQLGPFGPLIVVGGLGVTMILLVVAMFLTKHLLMDWRKGEQHFMRHLIDGDLAANNGGWQWSASTGTDAQPYFRVFNPWTQSSRFDKEGSYIRTYVPELAELPSAALHDPDKLAAALASRSVDYPAPIVEHKSARERAIEAFKQVKAET